MFVLGSARPQASLALLVLSTSVACSSSEANGQATQAVCAPTAPTECPDPAPHYPDVAPIFERCSSCHNDAPGAEWPLDDYEHVADWAPVIRDELMRCSMPPADSGVTLTSDERQQILVWIRCGFPE